MNEILTDTSPPALVAAIRTSLHAYIIRRARLLGRSVRREQGGLWIIDQPQPMGLVDASFDQDNAEEQVDAVVRHLAQTGASIPILGVVEPFEMDALWHGRGWAEIEMEYGMAMALADLSDEPVALDGWAVQAVADSTDIDRCAAVVAAGRDRAQADLFKTIHGAPRKDSRVFLATVHGAPAAISVLFAAAGVAAIWWVTTAPEFRNRGLGTAVTRVALLAAQKVGYCIGVLAALPRVETMYANMGFRTHCRSKAYKREDR